MASGSLQTEKVVRFGSFEMNLLTGELRKYGIRIRLGGQPTQILTTLLENPGEIVTREELRRRLWTDNTFVEFENGLNNAVKKLRSALGDSAGRPLYIETLPRTGYRFVAPVEVKAGPSATAAGRISADIPTFSRPRTNLRRWSVGFCLIAAGILAYGFLSPAPVPSATGFVQRPISEHPDGFGQIVSDGVRVYFLEQTGDRDTLVQTSTAGGPASPVNAPFPNTRIFDVSSDHSEFLIGNFEVRRPGLPLWIWPVQGGSPIRVGSVVANDASWAPDREHILYTKNQDIRIVRRDGSDDRVLIQTSGEPWWVRFSPDHRKIIFTVESIQSDSQALWEASADGSNAHVQFPGWSNPPSECCAEWTPDGKYLVFTSAHSGFANLWAMREKPFLLHWRIGGPVQLTPTARALGAAVLTRDGTRLFTTAWNASNEFVRYDSTSRSFASITTLPGALGVVPSKDGTAMAVVKSDLTLWRTKIDGSAGVQLTQAPLKAGQPQWSPDGSKIAFEAHRFGEPVRAYVVSAAGGPMQEILAGQEEESVPAWSPDGKQIAVALNVDAPSNVTGRRGIYILDWETHRVQKIPGSDGLTSPMWSPDGKYFTAKTRVENEILLFERETQKWKPIASGAVLSGLTWSHDSKYLMVQRLSEAGEPVYRLRAGTFAPERLVSFESFLQRGVQSCVMQNGTADGSMVIRLIDSRGQLYALDLNLP